MNNIQEYTSKAVRIAELAYGRRNLEQMEQAGHALLGLPISEAQNAGLYYIAIGAKWRGQASNAQAMLETVRGNFQVRAIQTLGGIHFELGRFDEAARLYIEALQVGQGKDAFIIFGSQGQISAIKSLYGDHDHALSDMLSLWPIVKVAAKNHPHLWPMFHNEIACEFLELGRHKEAAHASSIALASPYAIAYPEWLETSAEIARRGQRASRAIIAVVGLPALEPENVVRLDEWPYDRTSQQTTSNGPARVRNFVEWTGTEMAKGQKKEHQKSIEPKTNEELFDEIANLLTTTVLKRRQLEEIVKILRENKKEDIQQS